MIFGGLVRCVAAVAPYVIGAPPQYRAFAYVLFEIHVDTFGGEKTRVSLIVGRGAVVRYPVASEINIALAGLDKYSAGGGLARDKSHTVSATMTASSRLPGFPIENTVIY